MIIIKDNIKENYVEHSVQMLKFLHIIWFSGYAATKLSPLELSNIQYSQTST